MTKGVCAAIVLLVILLAANIKITHGQSVDIDPVVAFGRAEVMSRESLAVVTDPGSNYAVVAEHLVRLRSYVGPYVTADTRIRIRDAARERLTGIQHYVVVTRAIDLVAALGDTSTLEHIAADPAAVEVLGFSEPEMIGWIQQKARDHLDLEPPRQRDPSLVTPSAQPTECNDRDIVARQLCAFAMSESDPFLRADLWKEYREYAPIVGSAR